MLTYEHHMFEKCHFSLTLTVMVIQYGWQFGGQPNAEHRTIKIDFLNENFTCCILGVV